MSMRREPTPTSPNTRWCSRTSLWPNGCWPRASHSPARHDLDSAAQYLLGRQAQLRMEQGRLREAETIAQGVMNLERLTLVMHLPALTVLGRVRVRLGEPDRPDAAAAGARSEAWRPASLNASFRSASRWPRRPGLRKISAPPRATDGRSRRCDLDNFNPWDLGELAIWWRRCEMPTASAGVDDADPVAAVGRASRRSAGGRRGMVTPGSSLRGGARV